MLGGLPIESEQSSTMLCRLPTIDSIFSCRLCQLVSLPLSPFITLSRLNNCRVLLYSSFTPFIVIFLHIVAAKSRTDLDLLETVVTTLHPIQAVSDASARLYKICFAFSRVARGLVDDQIPYTAKPESGKDTLQPPNVQRQEMLTPVDSSQNFSVDMMDYLTYPEAQDISAILDTWDNNQASVMDLFGFELTTS